MPIMKQVDSSQIAEYGYDEGTQTLSVRFKNKDGQASENYYNYSGVDPDTAAAMDDAESKGSFLYANIKGKFDYQKIEPEKSSDEAA
jgi:hypothetical protein